MAACIFKPSVYLMKPFAHRSYISRKTQRVQIGPLHNTNAVATAKARIGINEIFAANNIGQCICPTI